MAIKVLSKTPSPGWSSWRADSNLALGLFPKPSRPARDPPSVFELDIPYSVQRSLFTLLRAVGGLPSVYGSCLTLCGRPEVPEDSCPSLIVLLHGRVMKGGHFRWNLLALLGVAGWSGSAEPWLVRGLIPWINEPFRK
ncbi:hypothetical protein Salat_2518300 [Sesamum alatum]|uniref:Uncharacterized protein n=1 Tax=Sesamum alatum TaxID=300844 RepID=A0AAE2CCA7_9LAMI|nr:hypothetical protein Salat_2518300 [Sesamum alatum]